jgi:hypothetical protein
LGDDEVAEERRSRGAEEKRSRGTEAQALLCYVY